MEVSETVEEPKDESSEAFIREFTIFKVGDCTDEQLQKGPAEGMRWLLYESCDTKEGTPRKALSNDERSKQLNLLNVTELKAILKKNGYKVGGRKNDLIKRIMNPTDADKIGKTKKRKRKQNK